MAALLRSSLGSKEIREQDPPLKEGQAKTAPRTESKNCMSFKGFSLHANTRVHECAREKLERVIRYGCRPTIAADRLEDAGGGAVRILLKNEWKGGVKSIVLSGREFVVRLLALIPLPRRPSLRYHGPNRAHHLHLRPGTWFTPQSGGDRCPGERWM